MTEAELLNISEDKVEEIKEKIRSERVIEDDGFRRIEEAINRGTVKIPKNGFLYQISRNGRVVEHKDKKNAGT